MLKTDKKVACVFDSSFTLQGNLNILHILAGFSSQHDTLVWLKIITITNVCHEILCTKVFTAFKLCHISVKSTKWSTFSAFIHLWKMICGLKELQTVTLLNHKATTKLSVIYLMLSSTFNSVLSDIKETGVEGDSRAEVGIILITASWGLRFYWDISLFSWTGHRLPRYFQ